MELEKPKYLYRGVIVEENIIKSKPLFGMDMLPPNEPHYDEKGRKIVADGNEYGIYMTDYRDMVISAYGNVRKSHGTLLNKDIRIGYDQQKITLPAVAFIYKISTDNLDIRKPWICDAMKGHYNNGFMGNEWIADIIPVENYCVEQVFVGEDILHPKEEVKFENESEIIPKVEHILDERRIRLERFESYLKALPQSKVSGMSNDELQVYREIFKKGGLYETELSTSTITNVNDLIKVIMNYCYKLDPNNIPMNELCYLCSLQNDKELTFDKLDERLLGDINHKKEKRESFIQRKGEQANTRVFDNYINMLLSIMDIKHELILNQVKKLTGMDSDNISHSTNIQIDELYNSGKISLDMCLAMKKEIQKTLDNYLEEESPGR